MKYSDIALGVLAAKEYGIVKTNAQFWKNYAEKEIFINEVLKDERIIEVTDRLSNELSVSDDDEGMICAYDDDFPIINANVKNNGEKPYLLFYKGDLSLLSNLNKNIAVIGLTDPDEEIIKRETYIVQQLVENDLIIVSGLAKGCDTIAHKTCLESNGKTIAILPTHINKVFPAENRDLAKSITQKGGLLISEYYKEPGSKREMINRLIDRDRLQAMFSKAIVLIASYRKGEGDSGSRHAMEAARKYEIVRYVMYNIKTDKDNRQFALNQDYVTDSDRNLVKILRSNSFDEIRNLINLNLSHNSNPAIGEQISLF